MEAGLHPMPELKDTARPTTPLPSRVVLLLGFGGLIALMGFAEFDDFHSEGAIQATNREIQDDFLRRTRLLERIRADVYVSGTYVRDYLLAPEADQADRKSLLDVRSDMDSALHEYEGLLKPVEVATFQDLREALAGYWALLKPIFGWTALERKRQGYSFLRDEVFPRRTTMLNLASRIAGIAEGQWNEGRTRADETFKAFRARLAVTTGLSLGLGLLLAGFSVREILALEHETAKRYEEIAQARAELRSLSKRLVEAQEEERRSIARELHDEVGQALAGIRLEMAHLSTLIRSAGAQALEDKAGEIKTLVEDSIGVVRNMALLLRPPMLDDLGLVPALKWQAREVSKRTALRVRVAVEKVSEDIPDDVKTCVYRVVQEAVNNSVQHSGGHTVRVTLSQEHGNILVSIQDDGRGFADRERGMGILGMEERVRQLGGSFSVSSQADQGALVRVVLPVEAGSKPS
jgi:signal transduction histidine kinase